MDTIIIVDLGYHVSLDVPSGATEEEKKKLRDDFVYRYTLGIEPSTLFHSDLDFLRDPFDEGVRDPFFKIEPKHIKQDQRETIRTWRNYLDSISSKDQQSALERLREWLEDYYSFRRSNDLFNEQIPSAAKPVYNKLIDWISDRIKRIKEENQEEQRDVIDQSFIVEELHQINSKLDELKKPEIAKKEVKKEHTRVSISNEVLRILKLYNDDKEDPILSKIRESGKVITQTEIIRFHLKEIEQDHRFKSISTKVSELKNATIHEINKKRMKKKDI